jgi:hypothetical protein
VRPKARAAVAPRATVRAVAPLRGAHRLRVTLDRAGTVTITVVRRVRRHGRILPIRLADGTVTLPRAGTRTVPLQLTAAGRRALAQGRGIRATATIVTHAGGARARTTRTLTLR